MLTPQDLQEVFFEKARFGGYSMQSVDEFLEPLIADYISLYTENTVLKSKMRLLVERLEAYRAKEAEIKQAIADTQKNCDSMIAQAEQRAAELMRGAESSAQLRAQDVEGDVLEEQQRLERAKAETRSFVAKVEDILGRQCALLEELKALGLEPAPAPASEPVPEPRKAYDFDSEADEPSLPIDPPPVPELSAEPLPQPEPVTQDDIASEIEQSVERIMESVPTPPDELAQTRVMPAVDFGHEDKFGDLQFGKNYDPTK